MYRSITVFTHHHKILPKLALKYVSTIYREARGKKKKKKKIFAGLVLYSFGRLHLKAAKLLSASVRQTIVITEHWLC